MLNNIGLPGLLFVLLILCLVILPFVVAWMASKKGRSPILWFFVSLVLGGVGGLLILLVVDETSQNSRTLMKRN